MRFASRRESPGCGSRSTPRGSRLSSRKSIRRYLISIRPRWRRAGRREMPRRCGGLPGHRPSVRPPAHSARTAPSCTAGILDAWVTHPDDIRDAGTSQSHRVSLPLLLISIFVFPSLHFRTVHRGLLRETVGDF